MLDFLIMRTCLITSLIIILGLSALKPCSSIMWVVPGFFIMESHKMRALQGLLTSLSKILCTREVSFLMLPVYAFRKVEHLVAKVIQNFEIFENHSFSLLALKSC